MAQEYCKKKAVLLFLLSNSAKPNFLITVQYIVFLSHIRRCIKFLSFISISFNSKLRFKVEEKFGAKQMFSFFKKNFCFFLEISLYKLLKCSQNKNFLKRRFFFSNYNLILLNSVFCFPLILIYFFLAMIITVFIFLSLLLFLLSV